MSVINSIAAPSRTLVPGILLSVGVAAAAFAVQRVPGMGFLSPLIIAAVIGIGFRSVLGVPAQTKPGILFSAKALLRLAIALLGLQLSLGHIIQVGWIGVLIAGTAVSATFVFTVWFGRLVGADAKLVELLGAGTSVCGASAIVATNAVSKAHDEDVAYALGCITFFGTLAVVIYPLVMVAAGLSPDEYGLWVGGSIHEVAQVVAAGFQGGTDAGNTATIVKLVRVLMLAPLLVVLVRSKSRSGTEEGPSGAVAVPGFVIGFVALVGLNSVLDIPPVVVEVSRTLVVVMLTVSLAAIGLMTSFGSIMSRGIKPLAVAAASTLFIASLCLALSLVIERLL